ncbi:MAG: ammonium transporter, partial [Pseudomonadota bacterium]
MRQPLLGAPVLWFLPLLILQTTHANAATDKGDTAFVLICTVLVLMMTIPGLSMFYAGLVRAKNSASIFTQTIAIVCLACVTWIVLGYSLAFTNGGPLNSVIGGFSKVFLTGIKPESVVPTFSNGITIPEYVYVFFQMTFAAITPALFVGAFAERLRFSALMMISFLWLIFVYCPIVHMVWYWPGPDALAAASLAVQQAATPLEQAAASAQLTSVSTDAGLLFQLGAIDFAGGTVVHINAGIAGLVGVIILGPRVGYGREPMAPHSLNMSATGACLLWVGWFGFNCGSNLEATGIAGLAMANTFAATAAAGLSWMITEGVLRGKPTLLGLISGMIAGLVAVTPASGFAHPAAALILGFTSGVICCLFCTLIKGALGYDDALDVFGIHCIGGIIGALAVGLAVDPLFGGTGVADYISQPGTAIATYDRVPQMIAQLQGIGITLAWSAIGTATIFYVVEMMIGLRPS